MMNDPTASGRRGRDYHYVEVAVRGHRMDVIINRPAVMNALHPAAHDELAEVFDAYAKDDSLRVAVIRGQGERAFCTGTDLKALAATGDDRKPASGFAGLAARFDLDKPVIAAVNGAAIGGGLEIVLSCDIAVAVDTATFGLPEPRVGLAAMGGGIHRLVQQVPTKQAMGLLLTGRTITAGEALRLGIVNEVVTPAELDTCVDGWAEDICACAPLALAATKQVARESLATSLEEAMHHTYPAVERMLQSEDAREGPSAFAERRAPAWKGR